MVVFKVAIASPLPPNPHPLVPLRVGEAPILPATAPASIAFSSAGSGASTTPLLAALNLLASWSALWLLALVRPPGICLPSHAPPG
jgi:hypothetical protein